MNLAMPDKCFGCSACAAVCAKSAIQMISDQEGFLMPHIDTEKCIKCRLCENICPAINLKNDREPIGVYAFQSLDDELRKCSSSGAFFTHIAEVVLSVGGVVFGAAFLDDMTVAHIAIQSVEDLKRLRGSKYVQSNITKAFKQLESFLDSDRIVLFSGTPCQIAAVKSVYPNRKNLLTIDVICFGVPSPLAWECYKNRMEEVYGSKIVDASFRDKSNGWNYNMSLTFDNGQVVRTPFEQNTFLRGFLAGLYNRKSCSSCPMRFQRSGSDITIGDFWGVETVFPDLSDKKGTSLVLINTCLGEKFFGLAITKNDCEVRRTEWSIAISKNSSLVATSTQNLHRNSFFKKLKCGCFDERHFKISFLRRILSFIYRKILRLK